MSWAICNGAGVHVVGRWSRGLECFDGVLLGAFSVDQDDFDVRDMGDAVGDFNDLWFLIS